MKFTFLGEWMSQTAQAIPLWEQVLSSVEPDRIIEIGTLKGNFSLYLYLFALNNDARFYTYDTINQIYPTTLKRVTGFYSTFTKADVFNVAEQIKELIVQNGRTLLFCDGGNKEREFNTFVGSLKCGDIIAVHDWGTEVHRENLILDGMEEIFSRECDKEGMTRFFQKHEDN